MKWYVIRVASGKEKKTKEAIENELKKNKNESLISNLLIPTEKTIQIRRGKKVNVEKNFFPGYIFVETESINEVEANIKYINGVASVLKQPLSDKEIERIQGRSNKKDEDVSLVLNEKVKIIDGPFNTFVGTIIELDNSKQKVKVNILIFGRETLLDLTFSQIIKDETE